MYSFNNEKKENVTCVLPLMPRYVKLHSSQYL